MKASQHGATNERITTLTTATDEAEANTWPYRKYSLAMLTYMAATGLFTPISGDMLTKAGKPYVTPGDVAWNQVTVNIRKFNRKMMAATAVPLSVAADALAKVMGAKR